MEFVMPRTGESESDMFYRISSSGNDEEMIWAILTGTRLISDRAPNSCPLECLAKIYHRLLDFNLDGTFSYEIIKHCCNKESVDRWFLYCCFAVDLEYCFDERGSTEQKPGEEPVLLKSSTTFFENALHYNKEAISYIWQVICARMKEIITIDDGTDVSGFSLKPNSNHCRNLVKLIPETYFNEQRCRLLFELAYDIQKNAQGIADYNAALEIYLLAVKYDEELFDTYRALSALNEACKLAEYIDPFAEKWQPLYDLAEIREPLKYLDLKHSLEKLKKRHDKYEKKRLTNNKLRVL